MASGRSLVTKAPAEHAVPKEPASDELAHTEGATRADGGRAEVQHSAHRASLSTAVLFSIGLTGAGPTGALGVGSPLD